MKNKILIYGLVIIVLAVVAFFVFGSGNSEESGTPGGTPGVAQEWMNFELEDVNSGEKFKISDFEGKPVLLESFAVWCPTCTAQQQKIKELHGEPGYTEEDLISISLDLDPSENKAKILEHTSRNQFTWRYAISPPELTQMLIDEFGSSVASAPSVPIVLICEDLSFRKLGGFGSRSAEKLKEEISHGCGG